MMREFQPKPLIVHERPDFGSRIKLNDGKTDHFSEILQFIQDDNKNTQNSNKVTLNTQEVGQNTHASPRDLNDTALESEANTCTPSKVENPDVASNIGTDNKKSSNFSNISIY